MKTILILLMCFIIIPILAQNHILTQGTFNSTGGHQATSLYSNTTVFGEYVVGEVSTGSYTGYLGFLFPLLDQRPPIITSIDDVPHDQGHQVQVVWDKCAFDDEYAIDTYYSIWRLDEDFEMRLTDNKQAKFSSKNIYSEPFTIIELARENPDQSYFWQRDRDLWSFIAEVPALNYNEYSYIAPTLLDSNLVEINYSTFKLVYHDLYEYFESIPDSGYSIDNIAPDETKVYIAQNGSNMDLSWDEVENGTYQGNSYPEVNGIWYKIYAGDSPDFICDEIHLIDTVTNLNYDYPISGEEKKFFKVIVSDQP